MFNELLSMSMMTYNRPDIVKQYLETVADCLYELRVDLYIFDGSTNDDSKIVIEKFLQNYDNIFYKKYEGDSVKERILGCLSLPQTEYIWLSGDKFGTSPYSLKKIKSTLEEDPRIDLLTFYHRYVEKEESKIYDSLPLFISDLAVPLTHWGSTLVRKNLIDLSLIEWRFEHHDDCESPFYYFLTNYMVSNLKLENDFKGVFLFIPADKMMCKLDIYVLSGTAAKHNYWNAFLIGWNLYVSNLKPQFNSVKDNMYKAIARYTYFFSYPELCNQRINGEYNLAKVIKYRSFIKRSLEIPFGKVFLLGVCPRKILKCYLENNKGYIKYNIYNNLNKKQRIIIYGAGKAGKKTYKRLTNGVFKKCVDIVGIADQNYGGVILNTITVEPIEKLTCEPYDKVLIAIVDDKIYKNAYRMLRKKGIKRNKIAREF